MAETKKNTRSNSISSAAGAKLSPKQRAYVDGNMVYRINENQLNDYDAALRSQQQGTNYAVNPSRYIAPNADVYPFQNHLTWTGFVKHAEPNTVYAEAFPNTAKQNKAFSGIKTLDPAMQQALERTINKSQLGTLAHEMAHVRQLRNPMTKMTPQEYEKYGGTSDRVRDRFNAATELTDKPRDGFLNPFRGSGTKTNELGAYITQYEALHPSANTVSGQQAFVPLEKTYLGEQILPPELGIRAIFDQIMSGRIQADPEKLKYVRKLMGQDRKK